ncbi:MAG: addiction module protein [Gammaproteobacteria bacterium]
MRTAKIERELLRMPAPKRARVAQKLLISLENLSEAELDQLWLDEAERRAADIDSGKVKLVPGEEVARKARALLK